MFSLTLTLSYFLAFLTPPPDRYNHSSLIMPVVLPWFSLVKPSVKRRVYHQGTLKTAPSTPVNGSPVDVWVAEVTVIAYLASGVVSFTHVAVFSVLIVV